MEDKGAAVFGCLTIVFFFSLLIGLFAENTSLIVLGVICFIADIVFVITVRIANKPKNDNNDTKQEIPNNPENPDSQPQGNEDKGNENESVKEETVEDEHKEWELLSLEEIQKLFDNEKDERLKPFYENYIKCYDIIK